MQFSKLFLATLTLGTGVLAAPKANVEKRSTPLDIIGSAVSTLQSTVNANTAALSTLFNSVGNDFSAQLVIIANVNADIGAVVAAANAAAAAVATNTITGVTSLTAPEVELLTTDIKTLAAAIASVSASLKTGAGVLVANSKALIANEVTALQIALNVLVAPLASYANSVVANSAAVGTTDLNALTNAVASLNTNTNNFVTVGNTIATAPAIKIAGITIPL